MNPMPSLDSAVLGRILLLQSIIQAAPDERRLMEMVSHGLASLPGVVDCAVCIDGVTTESNTPSNVIAAVESSSALPSGYDNGQQIDLRTTRHDYGSIQLDIGDSQAFSPYLAFVSNTANLVALQIENNRTANQLQQLNSNLDQLVKERTQALEESEAKFRAVLDNSRDILYKFNLKTGVYDYLSPSLEDLVGISVEDYANGGIDLAASLLHPDDKVILQEHIDHLLNHKIEDGMIPNLQYRFKHKEHGYRWFSDNRTVLYDNDNNPIAIVGNSRDITERKEAELRQKLLISELDHRVKNNLAAVMSIVRFTHRTTRNPAEFEKMIAERIGAMAKAHELLAAHHWEHIPLRKLIEGTLEPFQSDQKNRITVHGDLHMLPPESTQTLAIAIHELATNAAKYGSLSSPNGTVNLQISVTEEALHLLWVETGGPPVTPPEHQGFGMEIIQGSIEYEFNGHADFAFNPQGLTCKITLPNTYNSE